MAVTIDGTGVIGGVSDFSSSNISLTDPEITGGIYLGGTGSANYLDDYEEGTWTPEWNISVSYSQQNGSYVKIGRTVFAQFDIQTAESITGTTTIELLNLPFLINQSFQNAGGFAKSFANNWDGGNQPQYFTPVMNSTKFAPKYENAGQNTSIVSGDIRDNSRISGILIYETDS